MLRTTRVKVWIMWLWQVGLVSRCYKVLVRIMVIDEIRLSA